MILEGGEERGERHDDGQGRSRDGGRERFDIDWWRLQICGSVNAVDDGGSLEVVYLCF